jgi:hypothetical protein
VHFSALQPQRKDLLIRFGQRLQKPFRVDLRGDLIHMSEHFSETECRSPGKIRAQPLLTVSES